MRSHEEFVEAFGDELCGLLLASFAESEHTRATDHAQNGAAMKRQMRRGRELLKRMHEFLTREPKEVKPKETKPPSATMPPAQPQPRKANT